MVRHYDELMQEVSTAGTALNDASHNDFCHLRDIEKRPVLPRLGGHKVGASRTGSML
jgi:hypothetical protein